MQEQDKYNVNDTVLLKDNKEYAIIKKVENYYVFLSLEQPLTILVGTIKGDKINVIDDKDIIKKVLSE